MKSKPFKDVQLGETVLMSLEPNDKVGTIMWKGTFKELKENKAYRSFAELIEYEDPDELDGYDWVIVNSITEGPTIFNYDCDPSGVMVPIEVIVEDKRKRIGPYIHNPDLTLLASNIVGSGDEPETYIVAVSNQIFNEEGDGILKEPVINIVIAATGDLNIAKAIYRNVEIGYCDNNVKSVTIEGIDGLIYHKRVVQKYIYETKEIKYDKN